MVMLFSFTAAFAQSQPAGGTAPKPQLAEEAFTNVQVLRGISAKEFMETMGFFAAALAMTCSDCHSEASGSSWAHYADDTPLKQTTRKMVLMVNAINKANFGGNRSVSCYTCHHTSERPKVVPSLAAQYAAPPEDDPDEVEILPNARVTVKPEQILDRYIQALGGAAALGKLTSFTGKGTYSGFDSDFQQVPVDIYAKAPDMRAMVVHMSAGEATNTYDGHTAWTAGPSDLFALPLVQLQGQDLLAARLDAQLNFPGQLKQALTDWRAGYAPQTIDGRVMDVISGTESDGSRVKLYFDKQTGLLSRKVHYVDTAVGTIPGHVTYSDYRTVAGVKIPFQWEITWVDGQSTIKLTSVQPNAAIDAGKFSRPSPPPARPSK
jgi:photosynthetic reaction center cytochrome c subunit